MLLYACLYACVEPGSTLWASYMLVLGCSAFVGSFFRMANASNVANDSPPPMTVWWRPGVPQGWELQSHLSILCTRRHIQHCRSAKLLSQVQAYPCGMSSSPLLAYHVVCWHLECSVAGGRVWRSSGVSFPRYLPV